MNLSHPNFSDRKIDLKIKVCGMRNRENIAQISQLDIDMIGFIFYEKSPRFVSSNDFLDLKNLEEQNSNLQKIGVFVNSKTSEVLDKVGEYELDYVQLHGDESSDYCENLKNVWPNIKIIKAFSVNEDFDFEKTKVFEGTCDLFLFDTKGKNRGGNGETFDWELLEKYKGDTPFLLSGGISPENAERITKVYFPKLIGIDLNSRFEIEPGIKNINKLKNFISKIKEQ
jgi:phosphoribosylanthranilate isomerase